MSEKVNYGVLKDYDGNKFIPVGHSKLVYDENGNTVENRLTTLEGEMDKVQDQDGFKNIKVGETTIAADQAEDTLELAAGSGITLTPDATNDKVTISHSNQVTAKTSYSQNSNANASGNSFTVTEVKYDTEGHITGKQEKTITLPSDISGNAATATRLETPVNITITDSNGNNGNTTSLIGNTDITLDLPDTITANIEGKDGEYFFIDKENKVVAKISESGIEATNVTSSKTSLNDLKDAFDEFANDVITEVVAGGGLTGGGSAGSVTLNVGAGNGITVSDNSVNHSDTSTLSGAQTAGTGKAITSVTVDTFGHVTATGSGNVVTGITAGDGLTGSAISGAVELDVNVDRGLSIVNDKVGHSYTAGTDTTSTANPGYGKTFTVVDSVTKDTYGHVTKVNTKTVTMPGEQTVNNATITIAAGKGLTTGGDFTTNQSSNETITLNVGAGAGISVQDDTVTNAGVRSVAEGTKRGTIAVNTNGTTADVAVNGLGFEDDGSYHFIDNNEKVITKIDGAGVHATDFIIDGADTSLSGVKAQYTTLKSQLDNTKYAASTSVGGPAVSANKLNTNAGSSTNPVYFENGIPKATGSSLAKDITGNAASANKVNNKLTIAGKTYDGSAAVTVSIADLGVTGAMVYLGTSTTAVTDGGTEKPTIGGTAIVTTNLQKGNVVLYGSQEFVWTGSKWELLGDEGSYALKTVSITAGNGLTGGGTLAADRTISHADTSTLTGAQSAGAGKALTSVTVDGFGHVTATGSNSFKTPQTAVASPSTSGNASAFIDTISQNTNGEITVTKKNVQISIDAAATDDDVVVLTATDGTNKVTYDAKHAQKGPSSGYTSGNTTTSISGSGGSGTIKIPQLTVDKYGHVTAAADESVTITMPSSVTGNAGTADKWKTGRSFSITDNAGHTGTATTVDGSTTVSLDLPNTIAADLVGNITTTDDHYAFIDSKNNTLAIIQNGGIKAVDFITGGDVSLNGLKTRVDTIANDYISGVTAGTGLTGGGSSGGVTLSLATSGVTANSYGPSANATPNYAATFNVPYLTIDKYGRVTAASTKTVKLPAAYSLPLAANGTRGGIQIGYSESNNNYAVKLSSEKAYVTVPWTDTKVTQKAAITTAGDYPIILGNSTATTEITNTVNKTSTLTYNPSTQVLTAGKLNLTAQSEFKFTDKDGNVGATINKDGIVTSGDVSAGSTSLKGLKTSFDALASTANTKTTNGLVPAPGAVANKVWKTDSSGNPGWRDDTDTIYTLPLATSSVRGGVKIGYTTDATNRKYAVQLDNEKMYVNVPWVNTWTANAVGVAGYVAAPTKAANANMVWKTNSEGVPAWRSDDNDNTTYTAGTGLTLSGTEFKIEQSDAHEIINLLESGTDDLTSTDYIITQWAGTGSEAQKKQYYLRPANKVVNATLVKEALGTGTGTTKYLREDGTWVKPPNTTYTFTNKDATLAWGTESTIATVGGVDITVTMPSNPNTNTRNTAGTLNTSEGLYLIGAKSQGSSTQDYAQTYTHDTVRIDTNGNLKVEDSEATNNRTVRVTNSNGDIGIHTSVNRGLFDFSDGIDGSWIIYRKKTDNQTYIPKKVYIEDALVGVHEKNYGTASQMNGLKDCVVGQIFFVLES